MEELFYKVLYHLFFGPLPVSRIQRFEDIIANTEPNVGLPFTTMDFRSTLLLFAIGVPLGILFACFLAKVTETPKTESATPTTFTELAREHVKDLEKSRVVEREEIVPFPYHSKFYTPELKCSVRQGPPDVELPYVGSLNNFYDPKLPPAANWKEVEDYLKKYDDYLNGKSDNMPLMLRNKVITDSQKKSLEEWYGPYMD